MHLDDELVERFVAGALDSSARSYVEAELARCTRCAELVAAVARAHEPEERYVLGATIARGGMGTIVAAFDRRLGRDVAIKRLDSFRPRARMRFDREIEITGALQHPNIVPIYDAGELVDGRAFYAMRHVAGRDLGAVIEAAATLEERLALLAPIASAIDAVAYAHERGVIHRDLKPLNVLVGPFGETVVIDWGLAKVGAEPPLESEDASDDPEATRDGAILGTPRYMAPEQARGEAATARADVYALGAILYHALAGCSPGDAVSTRDTIEQRARGELVPLAHQARAVPRDLAAIVERAMAYVPEARYATAGELAADLRRFQTGQLVQAHRYTRPDRVRRFARRYRLPLAVAGIALAVTTVIGTASIARVVHERDTAREARTLAEREHVRTESLVQFMFSDLRNSLARLGRFDILRDVADRIDAHLDEEIGRASEPEVVRARAAVLSIRAGVADGTGQPALGAQLATIAHVLLDDSERRRPSPLAREIRGALFTQAGVRAAKAGDHQAARAHHLRAVAIWRDLLGRGPAVLGLVTSLASVGEAADRAGDAPAAHRAWREASVLAATALATTPGDAALERLARVRFAIGQSHARHGELAASEGELDAARHALAAIVSPSNETRDLEVMIAYQLADARHALGRGDTRALRERAHALSLAGLAAEPSSTAWRRQVARSWRELARESSRAGDGALAATRLELAAAEFDRVLAIHPGDLFALRGAAVAVSELAAAKLQRGDRTGARRATDRAVTLFTALAKPGDPATQSDLIFMLARAAKSERLAGNRAGGRRYALRGLPLVDRHPPQADRPTQVFYHAMLLTAAADLGLPGCRARARALIAGLERRGQMIDSWRYDLGVHR